MSYHSFLQIGLYVVLIVGFASVAWILIRPYVVRLQVLQNGVLVDGCIIEHRTQLGGEVRSLHLSYSLTFSYEYQGVSYTQEVLVSEKTYSAYPDGTKIRVRCVPDAPTRAAPVDFYFWSGYE